MKRLKRYRTSHWAYCCWQHRAKTWRFTGAWRSQIELLPGIGSILTRTALICAQLNPLQGRRRVRGKMRRFPDENRMPFKTVDHEPVTTTKEVILRFNGVEFDEKICLTQYKSLNRLHGASAFLRETHYSPAMGPVVANMSHADTACRPLQSQVRGRQTLRFLGTRRPPSSGSRQRPAHSLKHKVVPDHHT